LVFGERFRPEKKGCEEKNQAKKKNNQGEFREFARGAPRENLVLV